MSRVNLTVSNLNVSLSETIRSLSQLSRQLPPHHGGGSHLHPSSLHRWIKSGLKTKSGTIVKLESIRIGQQICSSVEALERFFAALNAEDGVPISTSPNTSNRSPAKRKRAAQEANAKLEALGY